MKSQVPVDAIILDAVKIDHRNGEAPFTQTTIQPKADLVLFYDFKRLPQFVQALWRESGDIIMTPLSNVVSVKVAVANQPEHQPLGTPKAYDTAGGEKTRNSMKTAKAAIAESIENSPRLRKGRTTDNE